MPVVSVINMKGGVGKTTLTLALADYLSATYLKRVLLIDLDPQASLTTGCLGFDTWQRLDDARLTLADTLDQVLRGQPADVHLEPMVRVVRGAPCSLLAATPRLIGVEARLEDQERPSRLGSQYLTLHSVLARRLPAYDYTLIDCPPSLGTLTRNGLAISDGVLIPVAPTAISAVGLSQLIERLDHFGKGLGRPLKRYGTILNLVEHGNAPEAVTRQLTANPDAQPIWTTRIARSVRAHEGYAPGQRTLVQRWGTLAPDLAALAEEFTRRVR